MGLPGLFQGDSVRDFWNRYIYFVYCTDMSREGLEGMCGKNYGSAKMGTS